VSITDDGELRSVTASRANGSPDQGLVSGDRYLSPDALAVRTRKAAAALHDLGVWQRDQVALLLRNDFAFFEATAGAALLGASPVPLNWHLTPDEIAYVLDDCGAKVLIAHADLLTEAVLAVCGDVEVIAVEVSSEIAEAYRLPDDRLQIPGGVPNWAAWIDDYPQWHESPRDIAGPMFYTSGTTGRPKGVRRRSVTPEALSSIERRTALAWGFDKGPLRSVMTGPLYHSAPNAFGLHVVRSGGLLVLQPRFDAQGLLALIEQHRTTHLHMVPTMFVRLLALPEEARRSHDLSSLQFVSHGAAPCPADVKRRMIEWWGPVIHEYYAMTEIGIATFCDSEQWLAHPGTVGRPGPGVQILIAAEGNTACEAGQTGEILVRSETTTRFSYHRAEQKTEDARRGDYVATGDVGYLDEDGYLFISDRKTDMVLSGGVNIYPAEIENVLLTLPGIQDCAVFGVPDDEYGERLVAVIQASGDLTLGEVAAQLKDRIAPYKIPREMSFAPALPREDSGKIKKRLLREQYLAGDLPSEAPAV